MASTGLDDFVESVQLYFVVKSIVRHVVLNDRRASGESYHVFRKPIECDFVRDFRDDQAAAHIRSVRGFARPLELDFHIIDCDQPARERNQRPKEKSAAFQTSTQGFRG